MPSRPKRPHKRLPRFDDRDFVSISQAKIGTLQHFIIRVGTAILGGDFTGNVRGENAIDLTTERLSGAGGVTEVAAGDYAIQIGALNTVSGDYGVRIGYGGEVSGEGGVGIGPNANASGESAIAIGLNSSASGDDSVAIGGATITTEGALGIGGTARLINAEHVYNTGIAPVIKRMAGLQAQANWPLHLCGAMAVFTSGVIDLTQTGLKSLDLPAGTRVMLFGLGIECESVSGLTVQPTIRFGATFDDDKYVDDRQTTQLTAAGKREFYLPETISDFETDPNFTVVTGATATGMTGRLYWYGILLEDE